MQYQTFVQTLSRCPKWIRGPLTRALYRLRGAKLALSAEAFRDRSILVLGPARTLADDLEHLDTSAYDVIVKFNNSLDVAVPLPNDNGLRCDVLFHSATDDFRPLSPEKFSAAGVRVLVHRTPTRNSFLRTLLLDAIYGKMLRVRHIPWGAYERLRHDLGGASPTSGLMATCFFLQAPVTRLAILGFTFYSTSYQSGYGVTSQTDQETLNHVRKVGHHDPDREACLLADRIHSARKEGRNVFLGPSVEAALNNAVTKSGHSGSGRKDQD